MPWTEFFDSASNTLFGLFDMFSGGGLKKLSIFALGIMFYISASIILQLLTVVSPELKRLSKEEERRVVRKSPSTRATARQYSSPAWALASPLALRA